MHLSCGIAPGPNAPAQARLAEPLGYERVWLFDSPALYTEIQKLAGFEAAGLTDALNVPCRGDIDRELEAMPKAIL
jgi:hypothetical protein